MRWKIEDTPEQAKFRAEFRAWLREHLPAGWVDAVESGDEDGLQKARAGWDMFGWGRDYGASGYGAPLWPKEFGGLGAESWAQQIVREELGRHRLPIIGLNLLGVGLAGPTLVAHGTQAQKERYLRKILTSEEIWCQLFSEPGAGSDLSAVSTRAVRSGDEWIVNGQKVWTSIAQFSKFGMLLARSDPDKEKHEGLSYFIVDMSSPGVDIRPLKQLTGSSEFNEVYFTDVRVPDENRVGDVNDGWRVARTTLMNERVALSGISIDAAAIMGGARRDSWALFLEQVPDKADPVVRQAVARFYIDQEVKEITSFRASQARQRGAQPGPEGSVGKVFNAELNKRRTSFAMNAGGINSVAWLPGDANAENRVHAFLRALANSIEGGTSEVLRNQMGERVLGLPRDIEVDREIPWKDIPRS
ncbi:MAG: acyl-CoA dehydrogenase family protein [Actinomycetota bacterium]